MDLMIVHITYSTLPSPKLFFLLTLSRCSLSIKRSTNTKHSIPEMQTQKRQRSINTQPKWLFHLQSKPCKRSNPACVQIVHTLAHTVVIIELFCVCLYIIIVIYIPPLFCSHLCVRLHGFVCLCTSENALPCIQYKQK